MDIKTKDAIVAAANAYIRDKGLTAANLANAADINEAYLSNMLRGIYTAGSANAEKPTPIKDLYFSRLAGACGYVLGKTAWKTVDTPQLREGIAILEDAKENSRAVMLLCETGGGKTHIARRFLRANPRHTYVVTVNDLYTQADIVNDLREAIGIRTINPATHNVLRRLNAVRDTLSDIHEAGGRPLVILDEAENLKEPTLRLMKSLYDGLEDVCGLAMIGTSQLMGKLQSMKARNVTGIPQLYSRFRAGMRDLPPVHLRDLQAMVNAQTADAGLRKLVPSLGDNYREITRFLEPALRAAADRGQVCDEKFFRLYHNMPA